MTWTLNKKFYCSILLFLPLSFSSYLTAEPRTVGEMKELYKRPAIEKRSEKKSLSAEENLGRILFFDPILSGSNVISCATCHNPSLSWGDGLPKGLGHGLKPMPRRSPTLLNIFTSELFTWDGRAEDLAVQALGPIKNPNIMNQDLGELEKELSSIPGYLSQFTSVYGKNGVTSSNVGKALAAFEKTIVSGQAPFDRYIEGSKDAISESARLGFILFNSKARCFKCHKEWNFSDGSFHDIGLKTDDLGRGKFFPKLALAKHAFKVPTLRNVAHRAPYMHNGSIQSLEEVIDLYDRGGDVKRESLSPHIKPLKLTKREKKHLLSFLRSLTGKDPSVEYPILPR